MFLSLITLAVALSLSVIAAYYSIAGLTAIFAAAVVPIMIMGSILELAKVVVTIWLHEYWSRARWLMKLYLVPAVLMLMLITSMGIFGFLSKAHSDQNLVSGDVQAKIAIYDEKIKTEKENIEVNPLYFAKERPMVKRGEQLIMVDDDRYPLLEGEKPEMIKVRFRTLGCYPLTAAVESTATSIAEIVEEVFSVKLSERATRLIDGAAEDSMEKKKTEGYF